MKNQYYAIYDNVSELYGIPVLFQNEKMATRWFKDVINDPKGNETIFNNPNDFELWKLGTFDNSTGAIEPMISKIVNGTSVKEV